MQTASLNSPSRVCQILQRGYGVVMKAVQALDLKPATVIDAVPYYSDEAVEQLRQHFANEVRK